MKTEYKYICFEVTDEVCAGRNVWVCKNKRSGLILAKIFYYTTWKEWCFTQYEQNVIFNDTCLMDTINFIHQLK
jgi:hypothetical protein